MQQRTQTAGFTLIELIIVVAIIGILAAIAYPTYTKSVQKSRRADAQAALLAGAQSMERCYVRESSYSNCTIASESDAGYYQLALEAEDHSFTITATGQNGQQQDSACAVMTIDHRGSKGPKNGTGSSSSKCW